MTVNKLARHWYQHISAVFCSVIIMAAVIGPPLRIMMDESYVFGTIASTRPISGDRLLLLINSPLRGSRIALGTGSCRACEGEVIIARGQVEELGPFRSLRLKGSPRVLPASDAILRLFRDKCLNGPLMEQGLAAVLLGVLIVLLGCLFVRILGALILGSIGAATALVCTIVFECEGLLGPLAPGVLPAVTLFGFLTGALAGSRFTLPVQVAQRVGLILSCLAFAETLTNLLGWPRAFGLALAILGPILSPLLGLSLLAASLLAIGLDARGLGAYVVLFGVLAVLHILFGGRWLRPGCRRARVL